ncbi:MAG TPA: CocE/NonD family hydrolase [Jatrophihabitantaceae bacterium]|jgi:putative CocE/NonD family hydrolase|nr:CocE/NonD family hydrolase [Jatrophihabitantaceae bacterium]
MIRRPVRPWGVVAVAVAVLVVGAAAGVVLIRGFSVKDAIRAIAPGRSVTIPVSGGAHLAAELIAPKGSGPFPLLVMPAAWGAGASQYAIVGARLAADGYLVVAYAQRGFGGSTGLIDFAGSATVSDVGSVISWALANARVQPSQVGVLGISYGAGVSLLAAANDPRIKAVVAMSAWADLAGALYPNRTVSIQALAALDEAATTAGTPDGDVRRLGTDFADHQGAAGVALLEAMSPSRSAVTDVTAINKNHTAVMIANGFEDSIFPPSQLISFFDQLSTPKRMQLAAGDHTGPEAAGVLGQPDPTWDDAIAWLDHYLRGKANGIELAAPVQLRDVTTGVVHGYPDWASVGQAGGYGIGPGSSDQLIGPPGTATGSAGASSNWTVAIAGGTDTIADAGTPNYSPTSTYRAPSGVRIASIPTADAAVWSGPALGKATMVSGAPSLHLRIAASAGSASVFCYLYDVDGSGLGTLMSFEPYTVPEATTTSAQPVTIALQPTSWTVPAGHHLALVIDTVDPRYLSLSTTTDHITLSSTSADPARFSVPTS